MAHGADMVRWCAGTVGKRSHRCRQHGATESGAQLPYSLEVDVLSSLASAQDRERVGDSACIIEPRMPDVSITGFGGAAPIPVRGGGWRLDGSAL
ncbi:hypothetical protein OAO87_04290 [bacterium]|nr:hypothetical protein [bacterium]